MNGQNNPDNQNIFLMSRPKIQKLLFWFVWKTINDFTL